MKDNSNILNNLGVRIFNDRIIILESTNIENRISQIILNAFYTDLLISICNFSEIHFIQVHSETVEKTKIGDFVASKYLIL